MRLTSYGAAREVTGSKHLLEVNGKKILLDCGMFQGSRREAEDKNEQLPVDPASIDMMVISHAHMDHTGAIPYYVKKGFDGPIFSTFATRDLCTYMLADSAYIQQKEVEHILKHKGEIVEPLYDIEDASKALELFQTISYRRRTLLTEGVWLTYYDAGHILGSAQVFLEIDDMEDEGKRKTLLFTGDLGRKGLPILRDPEYIPEADFVMMECTYGNRFHKFIADIDDHFEKIVKETIARGGKILVPAFALERTQEVVYHLHTLIEEGRIPEIPIFVDSPLASNVTTVFRAHPECFDSETYKALIDHKMDPFGLERIKYITDVADSKRLNNYKRPCVIIAAAGMAEHGRILHHLSNNIENPANTVMIVGYMAENTLGRRLVEKQPIVKIFGRPHNNRANCVVIDAFSGHADRSDLLDYVAHIEKKPQRIFLVHGEEGQGLTFQQILNQSGYDDVVVSSFGVTSKL